MLYNSWDFLVFVNILEEPDLTPPSIVIYDPASNQTVSGMVNILTIATDNDSIDRVEFYHNYDLAHVDYSPYYTHSWNTPVSYTHLTLPTSDLV